MIVLLLTLPHRCSPFIPTYPAQILSPCSISPWVCALTSAKAASLAIPRDSAAAVRPRVQSSHPLGEQLSHWKELMVHLEACFKCRFSDLVPR